MFRRLHHPKRPTFVMGLGGRNILSKKSLVGVGVKNHSTSSDETLHTSGFGPSLRSPNLNLQTGKPLQSGKSLRFAKPLRYHRHFGKRTGEKGQTCSNRCAVTQSHSENSSANYMLPSLATIAHGSQSTKKYVTCLPLSKSAMS